MASSVPMAVGDRTGDEWRQRVSGALDQYTVADTSAHDQAEMGPVAWGESFATLTSDEGRRFRVAVSIEEDAACRIHEVQPNAPGERSEPSCCIPLRSMHPMWLKLGIS